MTRGHYCPNQQLLLALSLNSQMHFSEVMWKTLFFRHLFGGQRLVGPSFLFMVILLFEHYHCNGSFLPRAFGKRESEKSRHISYLCLVCLFLRSVSLTDLLPLERAELCHFREQSWLICTHSSLGGHGTCNLASRPEGNWRPGLSWRREATFGEHWLGRGRNLFKWQVVYVVKNV